MYVRSSPRDAERHEFSITTRRPLLSVLVAVAATGVIWLVFARILFVPLPCGLLTEVI